MGNDSDRIDARDHHAMCSRLWDFAISHGLSDGQPSDEPVDVIVVKAFQTHDRERELMRAVVQAARAVANLDFAAMLVLAPEGVEPDYNEPERFRTSGSNAEDGRYTYPARQELMTNVLLAALASYDAGTAPAESRAERLTKLVPKLVDILDGLGGNHNFPDTKEGKALAAARAALAEGTAPPAAAKEDGDEH